jgi:integrase
MTPKNMAQLIPNQTSAALSTETVEAVRRYVNASKSESTRRAYAVAWNDWCEFCEDSRVSNLPVDPEILTAYISTAAANGLKTNTVALRLAAISFMHRQAGCEGNPRSDQRVRDAMQGIYREHGAGKQKQAATLDDVRRMLDVTGDDLRGIRDRAVLLVGFWSACRRSELAALTMDTAKVANGKLVLTIERSKTDQKGVGMVKRLSASPKDVRVCPLSAFNAWLTAAKISSGPIWRAISRRGLPCPTGMTDKEIIRTVQRLADRAGMNKIEFGGHSLRAGYVTTAAMKGGQSWQIAERTGHKPGSVVLQRYIRAQGQGAAQADALILGE